MNIGWSRRDITPSQPTSLAGQFYERIAHEARDPLMATAIALEDTEGEQAVLVSCDLIAIEKHVQDGVREQVRLRIPDLDPNAIILNATHTHTAPYTYTESQWIPLEACRSAYQSIVKSLLFHICALLLRHYEHENINVQRKRFSSKFMLLQPALAYIQDHFREPVKLEDIAGVLALSPSRTRHLFLEVVGERFKSYLLQIRIQEAKKLLSGTNMPITDIYMSSGFHSSSSFYREFKKLVSVSPQEYRELSPTY